MTDPIGNLEEFWAKDIVYRLRIADGDSSDTQYHLDAEAADEIEQLRDALGQVADEIRKILPPNQYSPTEGSQRDRLLKLAERFLQPPCPINEVEGWEAAWVSKGTMIVSPEGDVFLSWRSHRIEDGFEVDGIKHPWPEGPPEDIK